MMKPFQLAVAGIVTAAAMAFTVKTNGETTTGLKNGDKAPLTDTRMKGIDDKTYTLSQLAGKKGLVVVFSCNTCPFVVGSEAFQGWESTYNSLHKKATEAGIGFVLLNSNEGKRGDDDSMDAMKKHAADKGYTMPYLADENSALANAFGAKTTPHVFFFNENMELIYQGAIDNSVDSKRTEDKHYLEQAMTEHAGGKPVNEGTTPPRGCSIKRVAK